jgi:threonine dehydrogenase-like Zn-dependent dehydrogenase
MEYESGKDWREEALLMQAARVHPKKNAFVLEDIPVPDIGPGEVLVQVQATGLSRGLLSVWLFTDMIKLLPATLGHEIAGVVAATGPGVSNVRAGDRVHVYAPLGCGKQSCAACAAGDESACESFAMIGYALFQPGGMEIYQRYHDGGMAEFVRVPAQNLDKLADETSFEAGCKLSTAAISWKAVSTARAGAPGGTLLVTGASGANGSIAVAAAPLAGFDRVIAVATHRSALTPLTFDYVTGVATEELGPDWEKKGYLTELLRDEPGGVDAIVDFTPVGPAVIAQSLPVLNRHGRAVLMAGNPSLFQVSYLDIMTRNLCVSGCPHATRADVRRVAQLVAGSELDLDRFVTHRYPLDAVSDAMKAIMLRKGSPALVVLDIASHDQVKDEI